MEVFKVQIISAILLSVMAVASSNTSQSIVCYYTIGRELQPIQVEVTLCTHMIMLGSNIATTNMSIIPTESSDPAKYYSYIPQYKKRNPKLKVILSNTPRPIVFGLVLESEEARKTFSQTTVPFLRKYGFDGVDLDWEFPRENQRANFSLVLQDLRTAFDTESLYAHQDRLLLSAAVSASVYGTEQSYEPVKMNRSVDFINLMSYDFFPFGELQTSHNSPLFHRSVQKSYSATVNTAYAANYWVSQGMAKSKVMVGIPTYGYSFTLDMPRYSEIGDPVTGVTGVTIKYSDACIMIQQKKFIRVFDSESMVPYLHLNHTWVTYEDVESAYIKAKWIRQSGFGGVMTFNLNSDDTHAVCDKTTTFPLHRIIRSIIQPNTEDFQAIVNP